MAKVIHECDEDCTVGDDGCCVECGVFHDDPCLHCGGCGFHAAECEAMDDAGDVEQEAAEDEFEDFKAKFDEDCF